MRFVSDIEFLHVLPTNYIKRGRSKIRLFDQNRSIDHLKSRSKYLISRPKLFSVCICELTSFDLFVVVQLVRSSTLALGATS